MMLRRVLAATPVLALLAAPLFAQQTGPNGQIDDGLNLRFANGIAAIAEDKVITVDDVRRKIQPLIGEVQREAHNEAEFNQKLEELQDHVIQDEIDRVLIIKDFQKDDKKHVPDSFVDNEIADTLADQFDNDRSKFLAYLRSLGETMRDYRREVEEDIIYHYELQQQRKSQSIVSPIKIETFYKENKDRFYQDDSVHMRLIQLTRLPGESDGELRGKADSIELRLKSGDKFADLAKEFSQESRRSKGGDWGWMTRSQMKAEFCDPLFALKKGEATDPIVTPDGAFILFAEDRKYAGIQSLNDVRDQIERILVTQMTTANQERWLERLRRNGYVKHF